MCQICQMSSSGECHAEPDTLNDALPSWLINSTGNIKNSNYGSLGGISFDFGRFFFEKHHAVLLRCRHITLPYITDLTHKILFHGWKEIGFMCQMCQI